MREITLLVVHCAATSPTMDIGAKEIDFWHRERGYAEIGYHYVIRRDGTIENGRELETAGAHAKGWNANSIGICLVGGIDHKNRPQDNFTREQKMTLRDLLERLRSQFPHTRILGHRDLPGVAKACPSFDVRSWCAQQGINPERPS